MVWFCTASGWDQSLNANVNVRRAARAHRFRQVRLDLAAQTPLIPPRPVIDHRLQMAGRWPPWMTYPMPLNLTGR